MDLIAGIIIGIGLANVALFAGLYLERKGFSQYKAIDKAVKQATGSKVKIFMPKSEAQVAQEALIAEHEARGEGTPLEEIRK